MKKNLIITLLVSAIIITGCSTNNEGVKEETKTEYFDFTATEIVNKVSTDWLIDFTPVMVVDNEEETEKIFTYSSTNDVFYTSDDIIGESASYSIVCDDKASKASSISFFFDKDSTEVTERFLYHISSIAQSIDPNVNTDDVLETINNGFNDNDFAIYNGDKFNLFVSCSDEYFNALFTPKS